MPHLRATDCDGAGNPLTTLRRQTESDTSLKQDRLRNGGGIEKSIRSKQATVEDEADAQKAFDDFVSQPAQLQPAQQPQATVNSSVVDFENIWGTVAKPQPAGTQRTGEILGRPAGGVLSKCVDRDQYVVLRRRCWRHLYEHAAGDTKVFDEIVHFTEHGKLIDDKERPVYSKDQPTSLSHTTLMQVPQDWEYALHYVDVYRAAVKCDIPEPEKAVLKKLVLEKLQDKDIRMPDVNKGLKRTNTSDEASNIKGVEANVAHDEGRGPLSSSWIKEYATLHNDPYLDNPYMRAAIRGERVTLEEVYREFDENPLYKSSVQTARWLNNKDKQSHDDPRIFVKIDTELPRLAQAMTGASPHQVDAFRSMGTVVTLPEAQLVTTGAFPATGDALETMGASMADQKARIDEVKRRLRAQEQASRFIANLQPLQPAYRDTLPSWTAPNNSATRSNVVVDCPTMSTPTGGRWKNVPMSKAEQERKIEDLHTNATTAKERRKNVPMSKEEQERKIEELRKRMEDAQRGKEPVSKNQAITSHSVMFRLIDKVYSAAFIFAHSPPNSESDEDPYLPTAMLYPHANKIIQMTDNEELQILRGRYPLFHMELFDWLHCTKADYEEVVENDAGNWTVRLRDDAVGKVKAKL